MKRFFSINGNRNFAGFEILSENEMLKVRGGSDNGTKPASREKDIYELEKR
jgi:hypothetical protein